MCYLYRNGLSFWNRELWWQVLFNHFHDPSHYYQYVNISSRFSNHSESYVPRYYMHSDQFSVFTFLPHTSMLPVARGFKLIYLDYALQFRLITSTMCTIDREDLQKGSSGIVVNSTTSSDSFRYCGLTLFLWGTWLVQLCASSTKEVFQRFLKV